MKVGDAAPQPLGEHLLELRERSQCWLLQTGDGPRGGRSKSESHRERLFILEMQGRQGSPGPELVSPGHAGARLDRIAQASQPVDVAAKRPRGDLEPFGQLLTAPETTSL